MFLDYLKSSTQKKDRILVIYFSEINLINIKLEFTLPLC